jgi:hypothetical protein
MSRIDDIYNHAKVSEKAIEQYLVSEVERRGGLCLKYYNPTNIGYPDRIVILPSFPAAWVEVKSRGKKPRPIQEVRHAKLRNLGQRVFVIDSREGVMAALNNIIGL